MPNKRKAKPQRANITEAFVQKLDTMSQTERTIYWDQRQTGFGVRVTVNGVVTFVCVYRHQGRPRWYTIDRYPSVSVQQARKRAQEVRYQASRGEDPQGERRCARESETFANLAKQYFEENPNSHYEGHYRRYLSALGSTKANSVTFERVGVLRNRLIKAKKTGTIGPVLATGSKIWKWGANNSRVKMADNPFRGHQYKHVAESKRALEDDEIVKLWEALPHINEPWSSILRIMLFTGQRHDELRKMKWSYLDPNFEWWTQPSNKAKRIHRVYLTAPVRDVFKSLEPDGEYLFPNPKGEPWSGFAPRTIAAVRTVSGVEDFTPHMLRHTVATKLSQLGVLKEHRSKILNHAEGGITARYSHYDFDAERKAGLIKLERHLVGLWSPREADVVSIG